MKFSYRKFGPFWRPVIPVTLINKDKVIEYHLLIDTGADVSIIHSEVATFLGIKLENTDPIDIYGINGKTIGYVHRVELEISGLSFGKVPINFSADFSENSFGVLGHEMVFDRAKLVFEYAKKQIEIIPKAYKSKIKHIR